MRHEGQRDEAGIPEPRRAAISSTVRSNGSPQSVQTGRDCPVFMSVSVE
jgi:hypothetical protein